MELLEEIKHVLDEACIYYIYEEQAKNRHMFRGNELMIDAGMAADYVILDFNVDALHEAIFLGLIRLPRKNRGQGIGQKIVSIMKKYSKENHYSILLESASENLLFWQKMHFSSFLFETYGFWIMGYGSKSKQIYKVKWMQMKPFL